MVTKSAFTQARRHLKATAFVALNQKAVVDVLYGDENYETAWGFRLLAQRSPKSIYLIPQKLYKNLAPSNSKRLLATTKK
jgi:hypothetical protein